MDVSMYGWMDGWMDEFYITLHQQGPGKQKAIERNYIVDEKYLKLPTN